MFMRQVWRRMLLLVAVFLLAGCELSSVPPTVSGPALSSVPPTVSGPAQNTPTQGPSALTPSRAVAPTPSLPSRVAQSTATARRTPIESTPSASAAGVAPTMQPAARLDTSGSPLTVLAWSPDGQTLAGSAGARDMPNTTIHLWRADGTALATLVGHTGPIPALAWSPDGRVLASGSLDGTVRLWSATGAALNTLSLPAQWVYGLAWSPDGQTLAVGGIQVPTTSVGTPGRPSPIIPGTVTLWSPSGELRATLGPPRHTGGKFFHLAWSRDGSTLAAGAVTFAIWRTDGTLVAALDEIASPAWGMAFSPDGAVLATGNENGLLRLYTGTGVLFATLGDMNTVGLTFSPSGTTIAALGRSGVSLLDVRGTQVTVRDLPARAKPHSDLAWSPDGARLVAWFSDQTVQIWRADGQLGAILAGCGGAPLSVAWSPDGRTIAAATQDGRLCLWHP